MSMFAKSKPSALPKLGGSALPPKQPGLGPIAGLLKTIGFDPEVVLKMAQDIGGELKKHNDLLAAMNAKLDRIEARGLELENVLRLTSPEANMILAGRDAAIREAVAND